MRKLQSSYDDLRDEVQRLGQMTDVEREAQRRSFAYGNVAMSNPDVTREMVDKAADADDQWEPPLWREARQAKAEAQVDVARRNAIIDAQFGAYGVSQALAFSAEQRQKIIDGVTDYALELSKTIAAAKTRPPTVDEAMRSVDAIGAQMNGRGVVTLTMRTELHEAIEQLETAANDWAECRSGTGSSREWHRKHGNQHSPESWLCVAVRRVQLARSKQ